MLTIATSLPDLVFGVFAIIFAALVLSALVNLWIMR